MARRSEAGLEGEIAKAAATVIEIPPTRLARLTSSRSWLSGGKPAPLTLYHPVNRGKHRPKNRTMPPPDPSAFIAPLSLSNVLTVFCALVCLWKEFQQEARGWAAGPADLATSPALAAAVALMLLAGVFDAAFRNDVEWLVAAAAGVLIGRVHARSLRVEIDRDGGVRLSRSVGSLVVATVLVVPSVIDFASAARGTPLVACQHVAALAAFCAGFLGSRTYIVFRRLQRRAVADGRPFRLGAHRDNDHPSGWRFLGQARQGQRSG